MKKKVVIVESPAKAKTINKILGKDFTVKASMGHVKDLPESTLGIDVENGFKPTYRVIKTWSKTVKELKKLSEGASEVYLATDPDREGEAIAYHLKEALGVADGAAYRVAFNEITRKAIEEAFKNPGRIDMDKVNAQQARRVLDRLVGYKLSPLLWSKVTRGLSAGRVQSVAVRLIVDREREIEAFKPGEYWTIGGVFGREGKEGELRADLKEIDGKEAEIRDAAGAESAVAEMKSQRWAVSSVARKEKAEKPGPPFSTSLLQQQASIRLRFSAKKTMFLAQQLYEGIELGDAGSVGLITYMRTDSFRTADEAVNGLRDYIRGAYGQDYLSRSPRVFPSKKGAQAAHEAVRPTDVQRTPESLKPHLTADQFKLYDLIWRRFVASQMSPAIFDTTSIDIRGGRFLFQINGRIMRFPGFTKVWTSSSDKTETELPDVRESENLNLLHADPAQHFTKPPPRFTEATLVKTLEKLGIGRPSTYAPIISTIQDRGYVDLRQRAFEATEIGKVVTDLLVGHFPEIMDAGFTSNMEESLDSIEEARADWVKVLEGFYKIFSKDLEKAASEMRSLKKDPEKSGIKCPQCGAEMVYRYNLNGKFLGCSEFPKCKTAMSIGGDGKPRTVQETGHSCDVCGKPMILRDGKRGRFLGCSGFPECKNTLSVDAEGNPVKPAMLDEKCDKCGSPMVVKRGRRGPFISCSAWPKCKNAKPAGPGLKPAEPEKTGEMCEKCGKPMVIRTGRRGPFAACSGYPQCKTTKALAAADGAENAGGGPATAEEGGN